MPKNFAPNTPNLLWRKLLRFQRTFHEKSFVSGFGAEAPTDNAHKKARQRRAFLSCQNTLELRSKPPLFTFLERKVNQRTFLPTIPFIFAKTFPTNTSLQERRVVSVIMGTIKSTSKDATAAAFIDSCL